MAKADYYDLLGASRDTSEDDLKKAYRKLAMKYHPDRNPDDKAAEHKFKEISEAYHVLSDKEKRAAYDRFGHAAFDGASGGPAGAVSTSAPASPMCSTICSASSWAAASGGVAGGSPRAVRISATTWKFRWRKPTAASRRRSAYPAP